MAIGIGLLGLCVARVRLDMDTNLSPKDFSFLHLGISLDEIASKVGNPEPGGLYIYTYKMTHKRYLELRFSACEGLQGAWISHPNRKRKDFFSGRVFPQKLELHDFNFLQLAIPYDVVIKNVGEPHTEFGSGQHLAVYRLHDEQSILLRLGTSYQEENDCTTIVNGAWLVSPDHQEYIPLIDLP